MSTRIVTDTEGFLSIKEDWERLEQVDTNITYYSTFHFNYTWWLTHGQAQANQLFIICCYRDNKLVGIAPLQIRMVDKKILKCNVLCFLGKGDYFDFIIDSRQFSVGTIMKSLFAVIEENATKWDKIDLTHLPMQSRLLGYLLRHDQYNPHVKYLTSCPRIHMDEHKTYEQFSEEHFSTKMRKKLQKLRKQAPYRFKVMTGRESSDIYDKISHVHKMQKQYMHQEKGRTERRSIFEDPGNERFLKRLFNNNDHVVIFLLELEDGEIIIYSCCYLYNQILYDWNSGYSPEFSHFHGISDVLQMEMMKYLYEARQVKQIDLGAGSYSWKFKWTRNFIVSYSFTYWNTSNRRMMPLRFALRIRETLRTATKKNVGQRSTF
ncbi:GNAT family N-acetyltransferase [Paenibacillus faecalis]|uniref:GNAT family N-acetyltransferase n=1 Tax=Paenibacillus faecalis TaxID=2079532 RepID=UPI00131A4EC7|nr:GNAT family N-acetyltransferase [Paenibacillus faecalis]